MLYYLLRYVEKNFYLIYKDRVYSIKFVPVKTTAKYRIEFAHNPSSEVQHLEYIDNPLTFYYVLWRLLMSKKMMSKTYVAKHHPELLL